MNERRRNGKLDQTKINWTLPCANLLLVKCTHCQPQMWMLRNFVHLLQPKYEVPSRRILGWRLKNLYNKVDNILQKELQLPFQQGIKVELSVDM